VALLIKGCLCKKVSIMVPFSNDMQLAVILLVLAIHVSVSCHIQDIRLFLFALFSLYGLAHQEIVHDTHRTPGKPPHDIHCTLPVLVGSSEGFCV
jgi:hypothetical protein